MDLLLWIILFSLLGSVLSVLAAALFLVLPESARARTLPHLVSFAVGALLAAALLAQLPHAIMHPATTDPHHVFMAVLVALLGFFLLEKLVIWRHCHSHGHGHGDAEQDPAYEQAHGHGRAAGHLVIFGDGVHNFVDGVLIGAAFLISIELGIITALAVAAHEIPAEVGDFAVLLDSGFSRGEALLWNMISGLGAPLGAVLAYFILGGLEAVLPYVLAVAAASFLYIAVADLIPGLHQQPRLTTAWKQLAAILAGVAIIFVAHEWAHAVADDELHHHHGHDDSHEHGHGADHRH